MLDNLPLGGFAPPSEMLKSFLLGREAENIAQDGTPVSILAAFSGGADSSLMLFLLKRWCDENGVRLYAAHVDHGIRGEEAIRDREFCRSICEKNGIRTFILNADVPRIAAESGKSIESAARDVRYDFFADIMAKNKIPVLATAHNADDNLETVLFRLARGTALKGLCGIPPVREISGGYVVRPILSLTKREILELCDLNGIEYVYDSTNSDTVYARNSIRAAVLPILEAINPEVSRASVRMSELLRADQELLDSLAMEYISGKDNDSVSRLAELKAPIFNRAAVMLFARVSDTMLEYTHIEALRDLVVKGREHSSLSLPDRKKAVIERGRLCFCDDERKKDDPVFLPEEMLLIDGENRFGEYFLHLERGFSTLSSQSTPQIQITEENIYKLFTQVVIQSDKINGSLRVRCRRNGDKVRNGGMSKDVRKLFSEKGIPLSERASYPIVCDDEGILFIPNVALRDGVKMNKENENSPLSLKITVMSGLH